MSEKANPEAELKAEHENLHYALAAVQAEIKPILPNSTNPHFRSRYADLGAHIDLIRPILAANGLMAQQIPFSDETGVGVYTQIIHLRTGDMIESRVTIPLPANEGNARTLAQIAGSTITYLRRYQLATMVGAYSGDDDDGNAGAQNRSRTNGKPQKAAAAAVAWPEDMLSIVETEAEIPAEHCEGFLVNSGFRPSASRAAVIALARAYRHAKAVDGKNSSDAYDWARANFEDFIPDPSEVATKKEEKKGKKNG